MQKQTKHATIPRTENAQMHVTIIASRSRYLLGHNSDWWNFWMLASLGLVAIAAIAAVLTTTGVVVSQKREAAQSTKDFEQYKLEAGEKIASANAVAALANERAGHEALERAKLEMEFVKQGPRFTLLRTHRDELIKALRPFSGQRFTTLNEFANTDTEAIRTSSEMTVILESEAAWRNNTPHGASGGFNMFGVGVMVRILPTASGKTRANAKRLFSALEKALLTGVQFADNGRDVKAVLPRAFPFDEETILIEVGEHPTPISTPYAKPVK